MSRRGFVEHTIEGLYQAIEHTVEAEASARRGGLLQPLDPRVKVAGLVALILASVLAARLAVIATIFGVAVLLAVLSLIPLRLVAARVWMAALFSPAPSPCLPSFSPPARRSIAFPFSAGP